MTAGAPYNEVQILNVAYNLFFFNPNSFSEACREWRRLSQAQKNWNQCKTFFIEAQKDYMLLQTQVNHRFHVAHTTEFNDNIQNEDVNTVKALANLVSATATDNASIANLTSTNERLTAHIEKQLSTALQKFQHWKNQRSNTFCISANINNLLNVQPRTRCQCQQKYYCRSHGLKVRLDRSHTSSTCTRRRSGHQEQATANNRMRGYETGLICNIE